MNHSRNEQLLARKASATPRGVGVMAQFFAARAEGAELWDVEGRRFIDFAGGIAVLNVGHRHPKVVAALTAQLQRFTHTCYQVVPYESYVALAEKLNELTPGTFAKKTALFSTGAEAVENAIKIARAYTGRAGVIAFDGAFHGRSLFAVALTGKVQPYKVGFGPFPPEIYHVPFPREGGGLAEAKKHSSACSSPTSSPRASPRSSSSPCRAKAASTSSTPPPSSGCARCATCTASCSSLTRCKAALGAPARCLRWSTTTRRPACCPIC